MAGAIARLQGITPEVVRRELDEPGVIVVPLAPNSSVVDRLVGAAPR